MADTLRVGGLVRFSATDFPGRLAAIVFCQGCPWRCRYCHNPHLQPASADATWTWSALSSWLDSRSGLLDGVVFSGGEPTAQRALAGAVDEARTLGFEVGLHTAGMYPRRLAVVLPRVDWIGLDIKAPIASYETVTRVRESGRAAFESLDIVVASGVPYEVRTTVHVALTPARTLVALADALAEHGVRKWVVQPFRAQGCSDQTLTMTAMQQALDPEVLARMRERVPEITVR